MKIYHLVFSPTGGTERAGCALLQGWGEEAETVDLSNRERDFGACCFGPEDLVLISMPSFGGTAPQLALDRLSRVHAEGTPCVLLCVYGNRAYENTLAQMADTAVRCGFRVTAAVSAVAEHSMARKIAEGRPDAGDCAELAGFGRKILEKVQAGDTAAPQIPGKLPEQTGGGAMAPKAGSKCVSCGICAAKCPAGAIDASDPRKTDKHKCIGCMRCVQVCPKQARGLNPVVKAVVPLVLKKACSGKKANELML